MDLTPVPTGTDIPVNTYQIDAQRYACVTSLNVGGFVVSWSSRGQDGGNNGVFAQRFDEDGNTVGPEIQVNTHTARNQIRSSITGLASEGFVVTWSSFNQDGQSYGVYGQMFDKSGSVVGGEFPVNTTTARSQDDTSIIGLLGGGFVVSWSDARKDGSRSGIFAQVYDVNGSTIGGELPVNSTTNQAQVRSSCGSTSDGGFVITWSSFATDGDNYGIYGQRFDDTGTSVGVEFQINTHTAGAQDFSSAAGLPLGGFIVVWSSSNQDGDSTGIFGQVFDSSGSRLGGEFAVNTTIAGEQNHPSVSAIEDGGFVVSWTSQNQDGDGYGVFGQRFDRLANPIGNEFLINATTIGDQFSDTDYGSKTITSLTNGQLVAVWNGLGVEEVFARLIDIPDPAPTP